VSVLCNWELGIGNACDTVSCVISGWYKERMVTSVLWGHDVW